MTSQILCGALKAVQMKIYSSTILLKETRKKKKPISKLHLHWKQLDKEILQQPQHKVSRRKEIVTIRAEINEKLVNNTSSKDQES